MSTPEQEYAELAEEARKRRVELNDALLPVLRKQRAIGEGKSLKNSTAEEDEQLELARAKVLEIDACIDAFMERQGFPRRK